MWYEQVHCCAANVASVCMKLLSDLYNHYSIKQTEHM